MYNSGVRGKRGADGYGIISSQDQFIQSKLTYPSITGYNACNVSQVVLDDAAVTPGGYMLLYGTAFTTGMTLTIGTATVSSYTLVNTGRIFLTVPITLITGTYNVSIFSSTGGGAIFTTLLVSGFPIFTQTTYTVLGTTVVNVQLLVSGDAPLTFSLGSASTLPPGVSLSGTGLLSGTISPFSGNAQTYSFNINVDDAQAQTTTQLITLSVTLGDTYWPNNTLLLDSNTPGNVNTFVTDASLNNNIATILGDTRPSNLNPYQAGYYSFQFPANTDYLTTPVTTSNSGFSTGNFTVEAWIYPTVAQSTTLVSSNYSYSTAAGNWAFYTTVGAANTLYFNGGTSSSAGANHASSTTTTIPLNQWTHIAYSKTASLGYFFINGVQIGTSVADTTGYAGATGTLYIGRQADGTGYLTGYISNLRIVKGTGLYTASFTPSTTPLTSITNTSLLTCQSNINVDNSLNNYTITRAGSPTVQSFNPFGVTTSTTVNTLYSTYFDGTGDYLSIPTNAVFDFASGDFTVEAWIYLTTLTPAGGGSSNAITVITALPSSGTITGWGLDINNTNYVYWDNWVSGTEQTITATNNPITINTWYHVAVTRQSGTFSIFVNGNLCTTTGTVSQATNTGVNPIRIGAGPYTGYPNGLTGQISNLRVVKGVAVYTGAFTVPTSNLTATQSSGTNIAAITGLQTSLLTCQNSTIIDNSNNALTSSISSNGDARPLAVSPFTQSTTSVSLTNLGSTYFDGSGDLLTVPASTNWQFTGDYTLEAWIYVTSLADGTIFGTGGSGSTDQLTYTSTGSLYFAGVGTATGLITTNNWIHVAVSRSGTTQKIFINGVVQLTSTISGTIGQNLTACIGRRSDGVNAVIGYISNLRVVKGTALYTANFAPPVQPLTAVTNTQLLTLQTSQPTNNSMFVDNSSLSSLVTRAGNTSQGSFSPYGLNWSQFFPSAGATYAVPGTGTSTLLALGAGDFTFESWLYLNSLAPTYTTLFDWRTNGFTPSGIPIISDNNNNGTLCFMVCTGAAATALLTSSSVMPINSWFHMAIVRSGTALAMYFNGVSVATGTSSVNFGIQTFNIGNPQATNYGAPMYVTNVRMVKGTAVYTTAFSPPTTPLTPITNTQLLAFQNSGTQIDNSGNNFNVSKISTITSQRFSPFSTTTQSPLSYSGYFDGVWANVNSGDYLTLNGQSNFAFGSNNFTVEMWVYATSFSANVVLYDSRPGSTSGVYGILYYDTAGIVIWNVNALSITGTAITLNTWNHLAASRSGTTTKLFINGTEVGTATDTNSYLNGALAPTIGTSGYSRGSNSMQGYISNVRVVNGTAVYTANFTPSTTPLTAITNTSLLTCQSPTFIDNSTNAFAITAVNEPKLAAYNPFGYTTTQGQAYTPALFGGSAFVNTGQSNYLTVPATAGGLPFAGNFTLESWVYPTSRPNNGTLWSTNTSTIELWMNTSGTISYYTTAAVRFTTTLTIPLNAWSHVALVRSAGVAKVYINGVADAASYTSSTSIGASTDLWYVGRDPGASGGFNGYYSDIRSVNGTAVYTSNFVPPITPLTATTGTVLFLNMTKAGIPDYTRSIDLETVGDARITTESAYNGNYYSNYFDGTGDYLSFQTNQTPLALSNSDFTFEAWVYRVSGSGNSVIFNGQTDLTSASGSAYVFYVAPSQTSDVYIGAGGYSITSPNPTLGTWAHVAWCRTGGTLSTFLNGVRVGTRSDLGTSSINVGSTSVPPAIGAFGNGGSPFNGYISNARLIKGSGGYNANDSTITVPTTPLTAVTNTSLLTCQSNKFVDASTNALVITRAGDVAVKSLNPFILNTPTSMSFDGTGDYLVTGGNLSTGLNAFSTGDFTIEFWLYENSVAASDQGLIDMRPASTNGYYPYLYSYNGTIVYWLNSAAVITSAASSIITGVWYYITLTRSGSSTRLFINGVQAGSTYTNSTALLCDNNRPVIGCAGITVGASPLNGYIEDLRITKGIARYAGNFTVPTNKLPTF